MTTEQPPCSAAVDAPLLERQSASLRRLRERLRRVTLSPTTPVLLVGPPGSGKRSLARWLHASCRGQGAASAGAAWVELHCGSLPNDEIQDAMFGVEDGSGAVPGALDEADGGTLFLREVCRLPLTAQAQLAAFLETGTFRRRAGSRPQRRQLRVIASCRRSLGDMVACDLVREDLYDQLGVFAVTVPALGDSRDDILPLARFFATNLSQRHDVPARLLTDEAAQRLVDYAYPGNVRELRNIVERAMLLAASDRIGAADIITTPAPAPRRGAAFFSVELDRRAAPFPLEHVERQYVARVLTHFRNHRTVAAQALGISYPTFLKRLRELGINEGVP